jgi:hypothetical protein
MPLRQKQRVSELHFFLYDRPLHPELFDIYHDHRIVKDGYEAQVWVTGISHLVGFYRGEAAMVELLAESTAELPARGKLVSLPVRGEKEREINHVGGLRYIMSFQVEKMSARLYAKAHDELAGQAAQRGLFVPFPEWAANALSPFTYIDYEAKLRELHVFAYHAFPDELTLIKTQSIFELL